jgi:hypothetical protein
MDRKIVPEELRFQSPEIMVRLLVECLTSAEIEGDSQGDQKGFRILDIAVGNENVGEQLRRQLEGRVRSLAGCDILPAAKMAALRDRPAIYEEYVVADLADMDIEGVREVIGKDQEFDIITMCAALGVEPALLALLQVVEFLRVRGLVAICVFEPNLVNGQ